MSPFMDKFAIVSLEVLPKIHFLVLLNFIELVVNDDGDLGALENEIYLFPE
jgi:hypothetical protein